MNQELYNDLVSTPLSVGTSSLAYSAIASKKLKPKKAAWLAGLMAVYGVTLEEVINDTIRSFTGETEADDRIATILTNFIGLYFFNMGISKIYPKALPLSSGARESQEGEPGIIIKGKSKTQKLLMESAIIAVASTLLEERMDEWYADGDKMAAKQRKQKRKKSKRRAMGKKKAQKLNKQDLPEVPVKDTSKPFLTREQQIKQQMQTMYKPPAALNPKPTGGFVVNAS